MAQQFDINLRNSTNIKIDSRIANTPIAIGYDFNIPYGHIQIRGFTNSDILLESSLENGVFKILLDAEQFEFDEESFSASSKLVPSFSVIFVCIFAILFNPKHKLSIFCIALALVCCTCHASNISGTSKITIHVAYDIEFESLEITSDNSILVSPDIFKYNEDMSALCGAKDKLKQCSSMVCNISDKSCSVGNDNIGIGILVPIDGDFTELSSGTLTAIDIAAGNFGIIHPGTKLIVGNTKSDADIAVEVVEHMYDMGIRTFVGPSTSLEAMKVLEWSETKHDEVVFITPYASADSIFDYDSLFSVYLRNSEISQIYGNYMSFNYEYYIDEVLVVNRDDEYGRDLLKAFQNDNKNQYFNLVEVTNYQPNSINSPSTASEILDMISLKRNETINQVLLFISFGEIQYFFETDIPDNLKTLKWYCTDLAFVDEVITSDFAHDNAYDVRLESIQYAGSAVDVTSIKRKHFHNEMAFKGGVASFFDILLYDAISLMYESVSEFQKDYIDMDLLRTTIFEKAQILNGISGSLAIESHGARTGGDSYQSFILERTALKRVWKQSYILHYREAESNSIIPNYFGVQNLFDMVVTTEAFPNCTNYGAYFSYSVGSGKEYALWVNEEDFESGLLDEIRLTKYTDTVAILYCDNLEVIYICPADMGSQSSNCQTYYNTNSTIEYPVTANINKGTQQLKLDDYELSRAINGNDNLRDFKGVIQSSLDSAITSQIDIYIPKNDIQNWGLQSPQPPAFLLPNLDKPTNEITATLPAEPPAQSSR